MTVKEEAKALIDRLPDDVTLTELMDQLSTQLRSRSLYVPPRVTDPDERRRIKQELIESIRSHPFPRGTRDLSRDELHERG